MILSSASAHDSFFTANIFISRGNLPHLSLILITKQLKIKFHVVLLSLLYSFLDMFILKLNHYVFVLKDWLKFALWFYSEIFDWVFWMSDKLETFEMIIWVQFVSSRTEEIIFEWAVFSAASFLFIFKVFESLKTLSFMKLCNMRLNYLRLFCFYNSILYISEKNVTWIKIIN